MRNHVFEDENGMYSFDFSNAVWATDKLRDIFDKSKIVFCDVDFVVETPEAILFIEYKNANIPNAVNPKRFTVMEDKHYIKIARKFYDSLLYIRAVGKTKKVKYIYIAEFPLAGTTELNLLRNKILAKLPFKLQERSEVINELISDFEVLTINSWNSHQEYGQYPVSLNTRL